MLYPIILVIIGETDVEVIDMTPNFNGFSYSWTCIFVAILLFICSIKKDLHIFIKINSFGVVFTFIIIAFVIGIGVRGILLNDYSLSIAIPTESTSL